MQVYFSEYIRHHVDSLSYRPLVYQFQSMEAYKFLLVFLHLRIVGRHIIFLLCSYLQINVDLYVIRIRLVEYVFIYK